MGMNLTRGLLFTAAIIFGGCASAPDHEANYLLGAATSNFSKRDDANAAWFVGRAATKPFGRERVRDYFIARPELIDPFLAGASISAGTTESQETIDDMKIVLDVLTSVPGVRSERIDAVLKACSDGTARIALLEQERRGLTKRVLAARAAARILCIEREQCDRAFGMAEVFVSQNSDMKIQVSTSSVIETYNATEKGNLALKVLRTPSPSNLSEISLGAICRTDGDSNYTELCELRLLAAYTGFKDALLPFAKR